MEFSIKSGSPEKQRSACIVVGVFEPRKLTLAGELIDNASKGYLSDIIRRGDMEGKSGRTLLLHNVPGVLGDRVMLVGLRNNFRRDDEMELAFHVCTQGGADIMRLEGYGLKVGAKADLVIVEGETITHAAVARPTRRMVLKHGKVVARNGTCSRTAP